VRAGIVPLGLASLVCAAAWALGACDSSSGAGGMGGGGAGGQRPAGMLLGAAGAQMLDCLPTDDAGVPLTGTAGAGGGAPAGACFDLPPRRMPFGRMGIGAATAPDGLIYLITWHSEVDATCAVSPLAVYDPGNDTYRSLASPPVLVSSTPAAAFAAGKLVMIFGDTYLYDPTTDRWSQGSRSPLGEVLDAVTVGIGDRVYVFGGDDDENTVNQAQTYDPATDEWGPLPPSPTSSGYYNATVAGGKIYMVGPSAVVFDPGSGAWSMLPPPSRLRLSAGVVSDSDGHVLLFGGFDGFEWVPLVESFDPATGAWTGRAPMPRPTFLLGAAAGCGGSRIFVFGGDAGGFKASPLVQIYGPGDVWKRSL
jgi:hypothetical protein